MNKVDVTYDGKLKSYVTGDGKCLKSKKLDVDYTIDGKTGETTTTSILINEEPLFMITFDYQDLKTIVEGVDNETNK